MLHTNLMSIKDQRGHRKRCKDSGNSMKANSASFRCKASKDNGQLVRIESRPALRKKEKCFASEEEKYQRKSCGGRKFGQA